MYAITTTKPDFLKTALQKWDACRGLSGSKIDIAPPQTLVFYRDGVSKGELEHLRDTEIAMIKRGSLPKCPVIFRFQGNILTHLAWAS